MIGTFAVAVVLALKPSPQPAITPAHVDQGNPMPGTVPSTKGPIRLPNTPLPTSNTIVAKIDCELLAMVRDDRPDDRATFHRLFLLAGDYDVAISLSLLVNDAGGLAPSPSYFEAVDVRIAPDTKTALEQVFHNFTQELQRSFRSIYLDWKAFGTDSCPGATLPGALQFKESVNLAALTPGGLSGNSVGPFGGSVSFVIAPSQATSAPIWTLVQFDQHVAKNKMSIYKHEVKFAFAQGPHPGAPMNVGRRPILPNPSNRDAYDYLHSIK